MMKKYIILFFALVLSYFFIGCEENEIDTYNETSRINFSSREESYTFIDTNYLKNIKEVELELDVELQGFLLTEPRDFCLKVRDNEEYKDKAEVVFEQKYSYTALDTNVHTVKVKVMCPDKITPADSPYKMDIVFDIDNPLHGFDPGRVDIDYCLVKLFYRLEPMDWSEYFWGFYSDGKYMFMMDYFGKIHKDIERTEDVRNELVEAYATYRENNPPILDEDGNEIVFPN